MALQRTFSGFPTGYPGLALLLLPPRRGRYREFAGMVAYHRQPWSGEYWRCRCLAGLRHWPRVSHRLHDADR